MLITRQDLAKLETPKRRRRDPKSLASLAEKAGMPTSTLKTRMKSLIEAGLTREEAIEQALKKPIGPQGRPRRESGASHSRG